MFMSEKLCFVYGVVSIWCCVDMSLDDTNPDRVLLSVGSGLVGMLFMYCALAR